MQFSKHSLKWFICGLINNTVLVIANNRTLTYIVGTYVLLINATHKAS